MKGTIIKRAALLLCALLFACAEKPAAAPEPIAAVTETAKPSDAPKTDLIGEDTVTLETEASVTLPPTPEPTAVSTPEPTTEHTTEPTAEPTPEPTPAPEIIDAQRLASGEFDAFFDDAVFVGDSITKSFGNIVNARRTEDGACLGEAQFLGVVNMNAAIASRDKINSDGINFRYRGKAVTLSEAIKEVGAKKIFILLGTNELEYRKWDAETELFLKMFEKIRAVRPDAEIVVTAILPVTARYAKSHKIDIAHWNAFNDVLRETCESNGVTFFSFAGRLMDENGYLIDAYSSDGQYHLNKDGCSIWIEALRRFAAEQAYPDARFNLP